MKAIICTKYGSPDVLQLKEVLKPIPKNNEVLIKIHASSVTRADTMMRRGTPFYGRLFIGLSKPKNPITGTGFAGIIEETGSEVKGSQKGDSVFGETGMGFSTNAEYVCAPQDGLLAPKPENISFEEAATVCDGVLTSWCFLKDIGKIESGHTILINGASGSLGSAAVQIGKYFGAEVTGVCSSANIDLAKSLGADKIINYAAKDFTKGKEKYDIIFDSIGKSSFSECKYVLKEKGIYLSPVLKFSLLFQMIWTSKFSKKKAKFSATGLRPIPELQVFLNELIGIIKSGKIKMIIDRRYPLEQTAEAHRYIDTGHKKGNVVITFDQSK
jgi:NADPH:quinone reductase-like Zn-dependent oxidoreductase